MFESVHHMHLALCGCVAACFGYYLQLNIMSVSPFVCLVRLTVRLSACLVVVNVISFTT